MKQVFNAAFEIQIVAIHTMVPVLLLFLQYLERQPQSACVDIKMQILPMTL